MGSIRCGHCKSYHPTVESVRACSLAKGATPTVDVWAQVKNERPAPLPPLRSVSPGEDLPDGYYALENFDGQAVRFYKIETGKGKWDGYTFVKEQASDELFSVRDLRRRTNIVAAIHEQGVGVCQARYGQELGQCYKCGRTLTDDLSRSLGVGPTCRSK